MADRIWLMSRGRGFQLRIAVRKSRFFKASCWCIPVPKADVSPTAWPYRLWRARRTVSGGCLPIVRKSPSGAGYALENRTIVADVLPDLFRRFERAAARLLSSVPNGKTLINLAEIATIRGSCCSRRGL